MAAGGWVERSRTFPDGTRERWLERKAPGEPHVLERRYLDGGSQMRDSVPVAGTTRLLWPDETVPRTSYRPVAGYRSTSTSAPLYVPGSTRKSSKEDVIREARGSSVRARILASAYDGFLVRQETQHGFERIGDFSEIGGGVFGTYVNEQFTVTELSGRIIPDYAERSSGRLDTDYINRHADHHRHNKTGQKLLGYWHSHPEIDEVEEEGLVACPSAADLGSLESLHERSRNWIGNSSFKQPTLGLIIAPRYIDDPDGGWNTPLVTAFLARGRMDFPAVEFARAEVEGRPDQSAWVPRASLRS